MVFLEALILQVWEMLCELGSPKPWKTVKFVPKSSVGLR